jgi:broad specificity phosphatase PhoE
MEKHVYLVRHGESNSNADRILRGPHSELTETGKTQAEIVAKRVAKIGVNAIVSSPLRRTLDTAAAIAKETGLSIEQSEFFVEYERPSVTLGRNEKDPDIEALRQLIYEGHTTPNFRHSDEENFEDVRERGLSALALLEEHPKDRICVVSHGFFKRVLLGLVLLGEGFTGKEFQRMYHHIRTSNTGVTYIKYSEGLWKLMTWNDSAHLG